MSPAKPEQKTPMVRFDPVITAGNIISASLLFLSVIIWGARLEGRVNGETAIREEQHIETQRRLDASDVLHRDELRDIKDSLARIERKFDLKADKR